LFLLLAASRLTGAPGDFPGTDGKWQHFQTANFELYSRIRESDSRELLHDLETLRSMFMDFFKLTERRRLEVTIYAFKSRKDFQFYGREFYGPNHQFDGFHVDGVDRAVIYLLQGENPESTREMIFHEYIHHLFRVAEMTPPPWLNEGMADLFSTIKPVDGKLEFGRPALGRLQELQTEKLLPLEQLFAVDADSPVFRRGDHTGLFYAESWALVHYLYFGDSKIASERRSAFFRMVLKNTFRDGAELRAGFRQVFGMDYPEMLARLQVYITSGKYYWAKDPLPAVAPASAYAMRAVPEEEIRLRLAELALRVSRDSRAKLMLLQAVERNPTDARSLEALGAEALRDEDEIRARERWTQAAAAGTRNPAIYRELGLMEGRAVFSELDLYYRLPADKAARMRDFLGRSIEYNPQQTAAYEMLAWVEAFAPEPSIKNVALIQQAYPNFTRKERTALALALVRVRLDRKDEALEMLAGLATMRPDPWETYAIEVIRAHLEGRPIDRGKLSTEEAARVKVGAPKVKLPPGGGRK
jgi:hypothetical protein